MPRPTPSLAWFTWTHHGLRCLLAAVLAVWSTPALAINRSWDDAGGSANKLWSEFGNWSPDGDPNGDDVFIGNFFGAFGDRTLFDDNAININSLTITNGADVVNSTDDGATNDYEIDVNGATSVTGTGSSIILYGGDLNGLDTNTLALGSGGSLVLNSTTAQGTAVAEIDNGLFAIDSGGTLTGNGRVDLEDSLAAPTDLMANNGTITANTRTVFIGSAPAAGTLQITASSPDARFDWDGTVGSLGTLNVNDNQTLDIDVDTGGDAFSGTMNLSTGSTIDIADTWALDSGDINVNTGAFGLIIIGGDPNPGAAARIAGANWDMTGGTINLADTWDSLQFDSAVNATGGTINNSGTLIFNADATFGSGVDFNMDSAESSLIVNAEVNIDTPDFQLDGIGAQGTTTINAGGVLDLDLGLGADENFEHTINLNGGELDVTTADNNWEIHNFAVVNAAGAATSRLNGETVQINGDINVTGNSTLIVGASSEYGSTANVAVEASSTLNHGFATYSGGSYTGGGVLKKGTATILADTTWAVDTVDVDDGSTTINNGTKLTVNTNSIDDSGDGIDNTVTIEDTGQLEINLAGGGDVIFEGSGQLVYNGNIISSTFLPAPASGSALVFAGTSELNINGDGTSDAVIKLNGGTLNINDAAEDFRMNGGSLAAGDTNEIAGGSINGPGEFQIGSGRALRGRGSINTGIDGNGNAQLIATGGALNINDGIEDIGTLGTAGAGSVLNVTDPWNTNVTDDVFLARGTLQGSTITNDGPGGIGGTGLVTSRVINNSQIVATGIGGLTIDNPANNNDWDGAAGNGTLRASKSTLELRDNSASLFTGTVRAELGTVFANGFELEFDPGSTLELFESTYRSTNATDFGGTILVDFGFSSRINVGGTAVFENGSSTTLNADLELENINSVIAVGAVFNGGGELRNVNGSALTLLDGANVGVQVTNDGDMEIAGAVAGRGDVADFVQSAAGRLNIDLLGTAIGDFDRLVTGGLAQLDGVLDLNLIGAFNPSLGDSFTILSATGGLINTFSSLDDSFAALDAGLIWDVVYNPTNVQVEVILGLPGDFNNDLVVDAADYTVWRDNLGSATTLPGDPTPGMVTAADRAVWAANYGATAPPAAASYATAVPEPGALGLLLGGILGGASLRRRRAV